MDPFLPSLLPRCALLLSWLLAAAAVAHAEPPLSTEALEAALAQPVYDSNRVAAAAKYEQDLSSTPAAVVVRTGGEIRLQGYRTIGEVLESMPGVHLRSDRAYTNLGVRGISRPGDYSSRVLMMIDGVRINEPIYDSATGGRELPIDMALIDRVEFIAGPGSSLYGSNAVLGVVNIVTRSASQLAGLSVTGEAGSAAQRRLGLSWGGDMGPARVLLGASSERRPGSDLYYAEYDTPADNHGVAVGRDGEDVHRLYLKAGWSDFSFSGLLSARNKSVPTGSYESLFNTPNEWIDRYAIGNLQWERSFGQAHVLQVQMGLADYDYGSTVRYGTHDAPTVFKDPSHARWLSGELRYQWLGWRQHRWLFGVDYQRNLEQSLKSYELTPEPHVYADVDTRSQRYGLFVNDEWQLLPSFTLNAGLRIDRRTDGEAQATPRLALLWSATPELTLKWLHGSAFREPNLYEQRYADETQRAPPALDVEALNSDELVAMWQPSPAWSLRASLFRMHMRDLLELVEQDDGVNMFENRGAVVSRGGEVELTHLSAGGALWRASWSRQHASDRDTGQVLSDAPRSLLKLMVTTPVLWHDVRLGANLLRVGERTTLADGRLASLLRLNATLTWAPLAQPWSAAFGVYNLTDRHNADPGGPEHRQDTIALDGREFRAQLGWQF
jgi:iron complex outermembrane receptor protein